MTKRVIATAGPLPNLKNLRGMPRYPRPCARSPKKNISQMRETYERSKDALEGVLKNWEKSFDAAGQGAVALNRKIIDIAQRNINSSFDLAKNLAGAKNLAEAVEMQSSFWRSQLDTLAAQAEEVRTLSTQVAANAAKPMERGMEELKKAR